MLRMLIVITMLVAGSGLANAQSAGDLVEAAWNDDEVAVQQLVEDGVDVNATLDGATALAAAAYNGNEALAEYLLQRGADVNSVAPPMNRTPLHLAAMKGHSETLRLLLAAGADTKARDTEGVTPLGLSIFSGEPAVVEDLVKGGADPNVKIPPANLTALHGAAIGGDGTMAAVLLEHGAHPDAGNNTNETPLHYAAVSGNRDVAFRLIEAGATVDATDDFGRRPLHDAVAAGHDDLVELLIERGANVNAADEDRMTPLHWAAARGIDKRFWGGLAPTPPKSVVLGSQHREILEQLIAAGADVNARDKKKRTPLRLAVKGKHTDLEAILRKHGAEK